MPCSQLRPIGFIVLCENIRNGRICHISVHRLHAPVNHRMVQCVQSAAKIFTDFTRIVFWTAKLSRRCTARYGIDGLCTLLYAGFVYQPSVQRQILHAAAKYSTCLLYTSNRLGQDAMPITGAAVMIPIASGMSTLDAMPFIADIMIITRMIIAPRIRVTGHCMGRR